MTHEDRPNGIDSLLKIMQALRAPQGCPWDRVQTPESLTPYILEEACELIDAIEGGSPELILDELGDLLLQVVFQAQIFYERQQFDFHDVAKGIADKLVRRHPHVFARGNHDTGTAALTRQWDAIKSAEATHNKSCLADHLPGHLPALQRAQKLISRVSRADRESELPETDLQQLHQVRATDRSREIHADEEILGLALLHLVRLAENANLDAETVLRKTIRKITRDLDP